MKKKSHLLVFAFVFCAIYITNAQVEYGLSYRYLMPDYQGLITGDYDDVFSQNRGKAFIQGAEIGYYREITDGIRIGVPFRLGIAKYALSTTDVSQFRSQTFANIGLQGVYHLNDGTILPKNSLIYPYALVGAGVTYYGKEDDHFSYDIPLGLGLSLQLLEGLNIQAQSEYHLASANHLMHSVGVLLNFNKEEKKITPKVEAAPVVVAPKEEAPKDGDGDGVIDENDKCPAIAGIAKFDGCPDTDGDGVQDANDKCPNEAGSSALYGCPDSDGDGISDVGDECPTVAGLSKFNGCPDTDGDGIKDSQDECPKVAGLARLNGCPLADTDGDGVADESDSCPKVAGLSKFRGCPDSDNDGIEDSKDSCPNEAGIAGNKGCPEVKEEVKKVLEFAKRGIQFQTNSNQLKSSSLTVLNEIAEIMKNNPAYNLKIGGHTDSQGKAESNQKLSENRAKTCFDFLVNKGIAASRMTYTGYGEAQPIADNNTATGRATNRRVECEIYFTGNK